MATPALLVLSFMALMPRALSLLARTKQPSHALVLSSWLQSSWVRYLWSQSHALAVVVTFMAMLFWPIIKLSNSKVMAWIMDPGSLDALRWSSSMTASVLGMPCILLNLKLACWVSPWISLGSMFLACRRSSLAFSSASKVLALNMAGLVHTAHCRNAADGNKC